MSKHKTNCWRTEIIVLMCICFIALPSYSDGPPKENAALQNTNVEKEKQSDVQSRVDEITDSLLRSAMNDLLQKAIQYEHRSEDSALATSQVLEMCRDSQRVYCFFAGYEVEHMPETVRKTKSIVKSVYTIVLGKIAWVKELKDKQSDLAKCYESIHDKYVKMGLESDEVVSIKAK